ncbi:hypothetical protein BKA70DRAFT_1223883 [Coprinopsis sp. MPI-PUGE-AT-0042]|nr:hypothetical protein BKA70DRAFT_1223883 [Coprinopsis sp. MPI-PUGE-AT-0042]
MGGFSELAREQSLAMDKAIRLMNFPPACTIEFLWLRIHSLRKLESQIEGETAVVCTGVAAVYHHPFLKYLYQRNKDEGDSSSKWFIAGKILSAIIINGYARARHQNLGPTDRTTPAVDGWARDEYQRRDATYLNGMQVRIGARNRWHIHGSKKQEGWNISQGFSSMNRPIKDDCLLGWVVELWWSMVWTFHYKGYGWQTLARKNYRKYASGSIMGNRHSRSQRRRAPWFRRKGTVTLALGVDADQGAHGNKFEIYSWGGTRRLSPTAGPFNSSIFLPSQSGGLVE